MSGVGAYAEYGQPLTPRELDILRLCASSTEKETAESLNISVQTVKNHLSNAYRKLGVNRLSEAYLILGWLRLPVNHIPHKAGIKWLNG